MKWAIYDIEVDQEPNNIYKYIAIVHGSLEAMTELSQITVPYWQAGGNLYWKMISDNEAKFFFTDFGSCEMFCNCATINIPMHWPWR